MLGVFQNLSNNDYKRRWQYKYVRGLEHLKIENTDKNRFYTKLNKENKNGCVLWNAFKNPKGYGMFRFNNKMILAHRFSYEFHVGKIPKGKCVLHKCDVRSCVNPAHLFLGTQLENIKDKCSKGRQSSLKGDKNPKSILTNAKVKNIKLKLLNGVSVSEIACKYGVGKSTISGIKNKKYWGHL